MATKYMCPKCNRRFTEWGAEKYGFKCPDDQWRSKEHPNDVELVRVGPSDDRPSRRASVKKGARKLAVSLPIGYGEEAAISEVDDLETAADFQQAGSNFDDNDTDEDEVVDDDTQVLPVGEVGADDVVAVEEDLGVGIDIVDGEPDEDAEVSEEVVEEEWQE
ncbi:MAG TPA: hypothetical protein PLJ47_14520 [Candidatus Hydrogenedentes bacterium]|nr:hypothetical protein [Candidatus Hydrogenedentota bacterium]